MERNIDVKSYYIIMTLNELCLDDSEFTVTVTFGKQLSNGRCDLFTTNETRNIRPGKSILFSPPDGTSSMSDAEDYCYVIHLSADGIVVHVYSELILKHTCTHNYDSLRTHDYDCLCNLLFWLSIRIL